MKPVGVVRFPGTNCDEDIFKALVEIGAHPHWIWYDDSFSWKHFSAIILPGGFSYGDALRCGALAAHSPILNEINLGQKEGLPILGICNGFQILCEAGLLPGVLLKNKNLHFIDRWVSLRFFGQEPKTISLPIAHGEGSYFASAETLKELWDKGHVWCQYEDNPNGSCDGIAGVLGGVLGSVCGLMPHPERALHNWMGGTDGRWVLQKFLDQSFQKGIL